jgi:hypothetical protein
MALMTATSQELYQPKILIQRRLREFMRDQASSIIGHLVSVGEEQREMIELSRENIKFFEESLELSRKRNKSSFQVDIAKAHGDTEELKRLMAEAKAMD